MSVISKLFGKVKQVINYSRYKELGVFTARFFGFGDDVYKSEIVRSCVRTLAEHTSKANAHCTDKRIERLLQYRPNIYMNGKDFLVKVRTWLEIKNTAFIYLKRDDLNSVVEFYPIPYQYYEAIESNGMLFIRFKFSMGQEVVLHWDDLAVIRKDYYESDIVGDANDAILSTLELINTTNQGIANAVKATANLRGILKSGKAMLDDDDIKANRDKFVKEYLNLENEGGIAAIDSTQEFTPIKMEPQTTSYAQMKEFRENVYRYYGVNENIVTSNYNESQFDAFYEARIEPFLIALSLELTGKVFSDRKLGHGNKIMFESNRLQFASVTTKLAMVSMVDRGALTPNEWRMIFNLTPVEGGDEPIRRLDTAKVDDENKKKEESEGDDGS